MVHRSTDAGGSAGRPERWLRLRAYASGLLDASEGATRQRRWLDALRAFADTVNPGIGIAGAIQVRT
jgi:hypothetical protein